MAQSKPIMILCKGHNSPILNCVGLKKYDDDNKKSMFYVSRSEFAWFPPEAKDKKDNKGKRAGLIPYCKDCVQKIFDYYYGESNNFQLAVYYTCQKLDIPFLEELFHSVFDLYKEKSAKEFSDLNKKYMGEYIRLLNQGSVKYGDKLDFSYSDSDLSNIDTKIAEREKSKQELNRFKLDWGNQDSDDAYAFLEYRYDVYTENKPLTPAQDALYRQLCLVELAKRRKEDNKESTKDEQDMMIKLMTQLKINNFDEKKELSIVERMLETRIAVQEKEKPAFHFDDVRKNADYMGKGRDIYNHIYRPFKNVVTNSKEYKIAPMDESKDDEYYYGLMDEISDVSKEE